MFAETLTRPVAFIQAQVELRVASFLLSLAFSLVAAAWSRKNFAFPLLFGPKTGESKWETERKRHGRLHQDREDRRGHLRRRVQGQGQAHQPVRRAQENSTGNVSCFEFSPSRLPPKNPTKVGRGSSFRHQSRETGSSWKTIVLKADRLWLEKSDSNLRRKVNEWVRANDFVRVSCNHRLQPFQFHHNWHWQLCLSASGFNYIQWSNIRKVRTENKSVRVCGGNEESTLTCILRFKRWEKSPL